VGVEVIDGEAEIATLREEWDDLAARSSHPTIYNTYDYTMASWGHFDSHQSSLRVVVAREPSGELVGLLPLRVRRRRGGLEIVLEPAAAVEVDRVSLMARPGTESDVWDDMLPAILDLRWDVWNSAEVPEAAPLFGALSRLTARPGSRRLDVSEEGAGSGLLIDLSGTWPDFLAGHKSFRRRLKKFEREVPHYEIDLYADPGDILEGLDAYRRVDEQSWKAGRIGISKSDTARRFFADLLPRLAADGRSAVRILRNGSELLAADVTHTFGTTAFLHSATYTQVAAAHSPGTIFTGLVLCDFMKSEIVTGDLLTGHADYLRPWASDEVATYNVTVTKDGLKASALRAAGPGLSKLKQRLG